MQNRFGLDVPYFRKELQALIDSLENRTPDELYRYLTVLAKIVEPKSVEAKDFDCKKVSDSIDAFTRSDAFQKIANT